MLSCEEAVQYMSKNGIPEAVASRVLDHSKQRRKSDVRPLSSITLGSEAAD